MASKGTATVGRAVNIPLSVSLLAAFILSTPTRANPIDLGVKLCGGLAEYEDGGMGPTLGLHGEVWAFRHIGLEASAEQWWNRAQNKHQRDLSLNLTLKYGLLLGAPLSRPLFACAGIGWGRDWLNGELRTENIHILGELRYGMLPSFWVLTRLERRGLIGGEFFYPSSTWFSVGGELTVRARDVARH